jgi:hypothetical protein
MNKMNRKTLKILSSYCFLDGDILYMRGFYGTLLRCLYYIYKQAQNGYFLTIMEKSCNDHTDKINTLLIPLYHITTPWPFAIQRINVIFPKN